MLPPAEWELFFWNLKEKKKSLIIFHTFSYHEASWEFISLSPTELMPLRANNKEG